MIEVQSVDICNVRALGSTRFEPLPASEGATALVGPNGVGKSSVLTAMLWALYGVTPDGVPVAAMRRQGTLVGEDDCHAVVTFKHDEQVVAVERGLKGNKDSTYVKITVDGHETSHGAKGAAQWITKRLGLDAEGFLTAYVVRQKELDGLVKARPADRRRLIERLAGIDRMSDAVKSAREEENIVKRRLDVMPGSADAVDNAQKIVDEAAAQVGEYREVVEGVAADVTKKAASRDQAQQVVDGFDSQVAAVRQYNDAIRTADTNVTLAERDVTATATTLKDAQTVADTFSPERLAEATTRRDDLHEKQRAAAGAVETAHRVTAEGSAAWDRAQQLQARADQAKARIEQAKVKVDQIAATLAGAPDGVDGLLVAAEVARDEQYAAVADLRAEHKRLTAAITALTSTDEACCPTCSTLLPDPRTLIDSLTASKRQVEVDGAAANTAAEAANAEMQRLAKIVAEVARLTSVLEVEQRSLAEATAAAQQASTDAQSAVTAAEAAREQVEAAQQAARDASATRDEVNALLVEVNGIIRALENARDAAAHLPRLREAAQNATDAYDAAVQARAGIVAPQNVATDEEIAQARAHLATAITNLQQSQSTHQSAQDALTRSTYRLETAEAELGREKDLVAARAALLAEFEAKVAVRTALDSFRKDRIARVAPELSEVATDFVSRMTDGKFTAVDLDEDFTPVVTDSEGAQRPAAWLSGGEESAVALALRVAIGELVAGQRGGLLWLDEVLTAQDGARRPAMMRAISELPGRQVITINHVAEATDMVDGVFEVLPGPDGSTIAPVDAIAPVSEEALLV